MHRRLAWIILRILAAIVVLSACAPGAASTPPAPAQGQAAPSSAAPATSAPANSAPAAAVSPTPTAAPAGPKSDALIDAALKKGDISEETALVYKVYAQFTDARLPSAYQGLADINTDSHILDVVQAQFSSLSAEAKRNVLPYLVPPVYQGAWGPPAADGSGGVTTINLPCTKIETDKWDSTSAMHSPVRFWWLKSRPGDASIANSFLLAMDDDVWPKLTAVMGRTPLADGGAQCSGGGPEMDVYITPQIARSYAASYFPPGCRNTPSYIVLNPGVTNAILAHEFMHAIQWSYNTSADCMYPGNYAWLAEATASWAQNYVYPSSNEEHAYIPWFYDGGSGGNPPALDLRNDAHEYGAHLFFFYLTNHFGDPGIVKTAWDNTTAMKSVPAVDKAIPGGLDAVFGDFALLNVIEPPYDEYQRWDNLNVKPSSSSLVKDQLATYQLYAVADKINSLAIKYEWYTFADDARLVTFFNGLTYKLDKEPIDQYIGVTPIKDGTTKYKFTALDPKDYQGVKIQAYFKVAGDTDWQVEDWTIKPYVTFCRDAQAEKLTDLIVITSNSSQEYDYQKAGTYESTLQTFDIGCWRYGGDASFKSTGKGEGGEYTDEQTIPNVAFERTDVHPNIPYPFLRFKVAEGEWQRTYNYTGYENGCTGSGQTQTSLANSTGDLFILYGAVDGESDRRYMGEANANKSVTVNFKCPDGSPSSGVPSQPWFFTDVLAQLLEKKYIIPNGGKLEGSDDMLSEVDNARMVYKWNLETLAEPAGGGGSDSSSTGSEPPAGQGSPGGGGGGDSQEPATPSLPGVPDYPNVEFAQQPTMGTLMIMTTDSADQVATFYRDALIAQGWTDMGGKGAAAGPVMVLAFSKGSSMISITINSQGSGQTMFMISTVTQ